MKITQGYIDRSREFSASQYEVVDPVLNDFSAGQTAANNIKGGIAVLTLCNFTNQNAVILLDGDVPTLPTSPFAQREVALWIQYVDTVTGEYSTLQVPGPNLTLLAQANTDEVDIVANVTMAAFVVIFNANARSADNNAVAITRARIIGRRS